MRVRGCCVMCLCVWFVIYRVMVDGVFVCVCFVRRVCFLFKLCLCVLCASYNVTLCVCLKLVFECCLRVCAFLMCLRVLFLVYCVVVYGVCVLVCCCCLFVSVCEWLVQCVCLCCL